LVIVVHEVVDEGQCCGGWKVVMDGW
jgi:hypothetical protein